MNFEWVQGPQRAPTNEARSENAVQRKSLLHGTAARAEKLCAATRAHSQLSEGRRGRWRFVCVHRGWSPRDTRGYLTKGACVRACVSVPASAGNTSAPRAHGPPTPPSCDTLRGCIRNHRAVCSAPFLLDPKSAFRCICLAGTTRSVLGGSLQIALLENLTRDART